MTLFWNCSLSNILAMSIQNESYYQNQTPTDLTSDTRPAVSRFSDVAARRGVHPTKGFPLLATCNGLITLWQQIRQGSAGSSSWGASGYLMQSVLTPHTISETAPRKREKSPSVPSHVSFFRCVKFANSCQNERKSRRRRLMSSSVRTWRESQEPFQSYSVFSRDAAAILSDISPSGCFSFF